jgi:hypothetical protein
MQVLLATEEKAAAVVTLEKARQRAAKANRAHREAEKMLAELDKKLRLKAERTQRREGAGGERS